MSEVPDFDTDDERDEFICGVMAAQVWAYVVEEDTEDLLEEVRENEKLGEEYDKVLNGEEHEFGVAVADHYGLPIRYAGERVILPRKYKHRFNKINRKLGIEPSLKEKLANAIFFGVMGDE